MLKYRTLSGGEKELGIRPLIEYPFYDTRTRTQKFPFRTAVMIIALFTQLFTSFLTRTLLGKGYFPQCCDVLNIYSPEKSKEGVVQSSSGAALMDSSSVIANRELTVGRSITHLSLPEIDVRHRLLRRRRHVRLRRRESLRPRGRGRSRRR